MNAKRLREVRDTPEYAQILDAVLTDRLEEHRVLPVKRVADILGVNERTVRDLLATGELVATKPTGPNGARVGVTQATLIAFIQANTHAEAS